MTLHLKLLWAHELRSKLYRIRYRTFVRSNGGDAKVVDIGCGPYDRDYCADPFLFRHNGVNWLFYETLDRNGKGVLGCLKQEVADGEWENMGIVLDRPWHLSYPQVFEEGGHIYMIPESCDASRGYKDCSVTLYEASSFPFGWNEVTTLIKEPFADSTLYRQGGHYYLSCLRMTPKYKNELWHSASIRGPWTKHKQSDNGNQSLRLCRNGGSFQVIDGKLYRIAQDCNGDYGKRVFKVPIVKLSPTEYEEGAASLMLDDDWPKVSFVHTYNNLRTPDGFLEVIDSRDYVPLPLPQRIFMWARIILHTLFRVTIKRKRGFVVQLFGVQIAKGSVKERPALIQIRLK